MLDRTALPETTRPAPGLRLPRPVGVSPQFAQFTLLVAGIAALTFILFLYVLPNSQINAAHTKIDQLQEEQADLQRQNAEVLQEIARLSELKAIEARAKELGMQPVQSAIYLTMPMPGAQLTGDVATAPANVNARGDRPDTQNKSITADAIKHQAGQLRDRATAWVDSTLGRLLGD